MDSLWENIQHSIWPLFFKYIFLGLSYVVKISVLWSYNPRIFLFTFCEKLFLRFTFTAVIFSEKKKNFNWYLRYMQVDSSGILLINILKISLLCLENILKNTCWYFRRYFKTENFYLKICLNNSDIMWKHHQVIVPIFLTYKNHIDSAGVH